MRNNKSDATLAGGGMATSVSGSERRRLPRYPLVAKAEVTDLRTNARIEGRCANLSGGGCYIETPKTFPGQTAVRVAIWEAGRRFETQANVVFDQSGIGMGLMFTEIRSLDRERLHAWLAELSKASEALPVSKPAAQPSAWSNLQVPAGRNTLEHTALAQLIGVLVRKGFLTAQEGKDLLR